MTEDQLVAILANRYRDGLARGEAGLEVYLFGIEYAKKLEGKDLKRIALRATNSRFYRKGLRYGIQLARHVEVKGAVTSP